MSKVETIEPAALSRDEAARFLGISTDTLDRLRADGRLFGFRAGRRLVKFTRDELRAFMEAKCDTPSSRSATHPTGTYNGTRRDARADLRRAQQIVRKLKAS